MEDDGRLCVGGLERTDRGSALVKYVQTDSCRLDRPLVRPTKGSIAAHRSACHYGCYSGRQFNTNARVFAITDRNVEHLREFEHPG
uniref:WSC domain-containing protein n=1 Tax=Angiostrongylus cantonensis TaxID=6313 RepID=A0A0K0D6N9_ANGCA